MESTSTMLINIKILFVVILIIVDASFSQGFDSYKHINVQKLQPQQINHNYLTPYDSQNEDEIETETPQPEITFDFELKNQAHQLLDQYRLNYSSGLESPSSSSSVSKTPSPSSLPSYSSFRPAKDVWNDLQSFRKKNYLRSSKNALYITKKDYLQKDWCRTQPLIQKIHIDGCGMKTVMNHFCYGQCNSFYIPKGPNNNNRNYRRRYKTSTTTTTTTTTASAFTMSTSSGSSTNDFLPEDLTEPAFRSCAYCKPKKFAWTTVTFRCSRRIPQIQRKQILRIKQCKCIAEPLH